jgi:hypothetical protein
MNNIDGASGVNRKNAGNPASTNERGEPGGFTSRLYYAKHPTLQTRADASAPGTHISDQYGLLFTVHGPPVDLVRMHGRERSRSKPGVWMAAGKDGGQAHRAPGAAG